MKGINFLSLLVLSMTPMALALNEADKVVELWVAMGGPDWYTNGCYIPGVKCSRDGSVIEMYSPLVALHK